MSDTSAGAQLRAARESQGLSLAAFAASLKVTQAKLEALEADRIDLLPDATFARALAQTMCKALKIDPAPVLAALPAGRSHRLEQLGEGINAPFRDHTDRPLVRAFSGGGSVWMWAAGLVAAATALVVLVPTAWWTAMRSDRGAVTALADAPAASSGSVERADGSTPASPDADGAASEPSAVPAPIAPPGGVATPPSAVASLPASATAASSARLTAGAPPVAPGSAASAASSATDSGPLRLMARAESWVEVVDAQGRTLISRTLAAGEEVALEGAAPLKLKIGNALGTDVVFRGAPVDLAARTRDNVARLEIPR